MQQIKSELHFPAPEDAQPAVPDANPTATTVSTESPGGSPHAEGDYPTSMLQKIRDSVVQAFLKTREKEYADFEKGLQRNAYAVQRHRYMTESISSRRQAIDAVEARILKAKNVHPGVTLAKAGVDIYNATKFNETVFVLCREVLLAEHGDSILKVMRDELSIMEHELESFKQEYRAELKQQGLL
jgi:hypothetical protein